MKITHISASQSEGGAYVNLTISLEHPSSSMVEDIMEVLNHWEGLSKSKPLLETGSLKVSTQPDMCSWQQGIDKLIPVQDTAAQDTAAQAAPARATTASKLADANIPRARRVRQKEVEEEVKDETLEAEVATIISDTDMAKGASLAASKFGPKFVKNILAEYTTGMVNTIPQEYRKAFLDAIKNGE